MSRVIFRRCCGMDIHKDKGRFKEFHRTLLKTHYAAYQILTRQVEELEARRSRAGCSRMRIG